MDDNSDLFYKESITLNIEDSSSQGFFSFFLSKKQVLSLCPYKDMLIILMSDYSIILYEILNKSKKLETKEIEKYKPMEIKILYYQIPLFNKDYILIICENNILLLNITSFIVEYNLNLKDKVYSSELFVLNNIYFLSILSEYKIYLYSLNINKKEKCLISFDIYQEFPKLNDKIINMKIFFDTNLFFYQTEKKIYFYTFRTKINSNSKEIIFDKKENFQDNIPNKDELNNLNKKIETLYDTYKSDKYKSLDLYKNIIIDYTKLNNYFVFAIYNKLFIIHSFYNINKHDISESNIEVNKGENKLKILDRITKDNIIILIKIFEPYLFILCDNKIYVYITFDHNKCIYQTNFDPSFDILLYKPISLFTNLHLLNYSKDVINYNDEILLNEIYKNKKKDESFNSRPIIYSYHNKDYKLNYFCFENFLKHYNLIKDIKVDYASKLLSNLDYNRKNNNENIQYYNRDLDKQNRKYIEYELINLFFEEINKNNLENSLLLYNDNNMNIIFVLIVIKNFIKSELLNNLLILSLFEYIYKVSFDFDKIKISLINNKDDNNKQLSNIIKYFFGTLMLKRNEIKNNFTPEELKYITLDNIKNEIKLNQIKTKLDLNEDDYNNNIEIIKLMEKRNENIIYFILLENIIFILNYYSFIISKDEKFLSNLFGLIKMSISILDENLLDLLKESNLYNLILLFYFSKGSYEQCFDFIIKLYEKAPMNFDNESEKNELLESNVFFDNCIYNYENKKNISITDKLNEEKYPKSYWFQSYIFLIYKIYSKLSEKDFNKKLEWALKENSCKTIDLLLYYNIINNKKVNYSFIDLLNPYGLDPIIHYFSVFSNLKDGKAESNEIINLYSIKIKLLSAENKENQFLKEIEDIRNKLSKFLIKNKNYDVEKAYERIIMDISFCEKEIGILLIKKKEYENGLNKIMDFDNDKNNESDILDLILLIVEEIPSFELVNLIFEKLKNIQLINNTVESIVLQILKRLSNHTDILIDILSTNILDEYDNFEISKFFTENIFLLEKKILYNKIEASLIGSQILDHKNILFDKQSESALINYKTICNKCKNCIYDESEINDKDKNISEEFKNCGVKTSNGKIYHFECFNNL